MNFLKKCLGLFVIAAFSASLGGCFVQVAYNNADKLATWKADDYFQLRDEQKEFVRERIRHHLTWHREYELDQYVLFIDDISRRIRRGLSSDDIDWLQEQIFAFRERLADTLATDAAAFLSSTDLEQLSHLFEQFDRLNRQAAKNLSLNLQERAAQRTERMVALVERWAGRLSASQHDHIQKLSENFPNSTEQWYAYQRTRQALFESITIASQKGENVSVDLRNWMLMRSFSAIPAFYPALRETLIAVDRMLTPKQRQHVLDELAKIRQTLTKLQGHRES